MIAALLALAAAATTPIRCGAVERPGIAERGGDGNWRGVAVDLCRTAAQGSGATIAFHAYHTAQDLRDARIDTIAVLSRAELAIAQPSPTVPAGRPVAISRQLLLVRPGAPWRSQTDLAGHKVCFIVGSAAEAALNAWSRDANIAIMRVGFQEPVELRDAFDAGYCAAMAVDDRDIPGGAEHTQALGKALAELAIFAVKIR